MKVLFGKLFNRLRKPETIAQALSYLLGDEYLSKALELNGPRSLIEKVARLANKDASALLEDVGKLLEIDVVHQIEPPNREQIAHWGYTIAALRAASAIPQASETSPEGFWIVVSDLDVLDRKIFESRGVRVLLALSTTIEDSWSAFDRRENQSDSDISIDKVFAVLAKLVTDSKACGANEIFLGHPEREKYEFFANEQRFSGKIHPKIYPALLSQFKEIPKITRRVSVENIDSISVALTRSFDHPVLCITWNDVDKSESSDERKGIEQVKRESAVSSQSQQELKPDETAEHQKSVLLVDDDERFLSILNKIFISKGWQVETLNRATKALLRLQGEQELPDLVVSDIHMPEMDGATFLRKLRKAEILIPILMLTSDDDSLLEVELALLGADAFVRKQEDPRVLLAWCNNLLSKTKTPLPSQIVEAEEAGSYLQ